MQQTARQAALATGQKTYLGAPCKRGHAGWRFTSTMGCRDCAAARRNTPEAKAEAAAYRAAHAEEAKDYGRQHWERYKDERNAERREHTKRAPGHRKEQSRLYYERNKERICARNRDPAVRARFRARDNHLSRLKKARRIQATPAWANLEAIRAFYAEAEALGLHVDHVIPMRGRLVCGLHVENNLQLLDSVANMRKNNSFDPATHVEPPPRWMQNAANDA